MRQRNRSIEMISTEGIGVFGVVFIQGKLRLGEEVETLEERKVDKKSHVCGAALVMTTWIIDPVVLLANLARQSWGNNVLAMPIPSHSFFQQKVRCDCSSFVQNMYCGS